MVDGGVENVSGQIAIRVYHRYNDILDLYTTYLRSLLSIKVFTQNYTINNENRHVDKNKNNETWQLFKNYTSQLIG